MVCSVVVCSVGVCSVMVCSVMVCSVVVRSVVVCSVMVCSVVVCSVVVCRTFIIIIIINFLHTLGHLTCSGIDTLPSLPGASTIPSSSRFVVHGVFRKSGVVHSLEMVDPLLFVFVSHVLYCRDL